MSGGSTGGFNFSMPAATAATSTAAPSGFTLGANPTGAFNFGVAPTTSAGSGSLFNFSSGAAASGTATSTTNSAAATTAGPAPFNFNFAARPTLGTSSATTVSASSSAPGSTAGVFNFSFATPSSTAQPSVSASAPGFPFGTSNVTASTAPSFGLGTAQQMGAATAPKVSASPFGTAAALQQGTVVSPATAAPSFGTGPALQLGTASTSAITTATTSSVPAMSSGGFTFGTPSTTASILGSSLSMAPTTASGFGNLFGPKTTSSTSTSVLSFSSPSSAFTAPTLSMAASSAAPASLSTSTTTTSSGLGGMTVAPTLSVRALEEKLNKYMLELKEQEERFLRQAAHVNAWDQVLQQGHDQVQSLKDTLHGVKSDQSRLEAELDFIKGQQEELERLLEPLEAAVNSSPATQHQGDRQRDNMYLLAQNLDAQLRQMTDDLCKVIEHLNTNTNGAQPSDPVSMVARILSAHMDTLKWVDQNATLLSQKVEALGHVADGRRGV